ncbi:MAG TPA: HsdR family type I site-specific deoxyribonuclease [Phycisphaerae bacterium]|nr:HsdR family type I site-specific deoxyribonuclease [Phycisphaerae bacterium]
MSNPTTPSYREDDASQIPALRMLINLGYEYLTPDEAVRLRGGKTSGVILDGVLEKQLPKLNRISFKKQEYAFSEGNIQSAIMSLKDVLYDGLVRTNEKAYDLLTLGRSMPQTILGDTKSFPLIYIDWNRAGTNADPNVYHVTAEFVVDRPGTGETRRPDIVLFVNGIPLCVIECKTPTLAGHEKPVEQAISQMIRNQKDEGGIPRLFVFSQLLLAVSKNDAKYGTCGTATKFWAGWREREDTEAQVAAIVKQPLATEMKDQLFTGPFRYARATFDEIEVAGGREVTEQDRAIYSLCRPARLLELTLRYMLFDAGEKKIARYQQYFTVKEIMKRIRQRDTAGRRKGGVVWHTQGSGKSLTMVMLAEAIAMEQEIGDYKIVLVTDRVDLDDQIYKTFAHCGAEVEQAKSSTDLGGLLNGSTKRIITTVINKFESISYRSGVRNKDPNIFVLVDEGHRGQYGQIHANMCRVLPNACFIGFTGTPVMRKERDTIKTFGGLIPPPYTIDQAVADNAVVRLLYEGRHVEQNVEAAAIDSWFDKITESLTNKQKADLKRKFAQTDQLNKAEQKVMRVAYDISVHFRDNWKGTGFKAQLVTPSKVTALLYKKYLDEFGMVSSEVLISGPDDREGEEDINAPSSDAVKQYWQYTVGKNARFLTEKDYNRTIIEAFKHGESPEVIIVVDKLLTGFDASRNTILYLARKLEDYLLLQAIARVNRLHEGKEFGYIIDYRGVLGALDTAMALYRSLENYDAKDLEGTLIDIEAHVALLPQRHSDLWSIFKDVRNNNDPEAFEQLLIDDKLRDDFYKALSTYARTLGIALSSASFLEQTPQEKLNRYKVDLKFFANLRTAVKRRYAEEVDFGEYEPKIQKLIDTYVGTGEVQQITPLVDIFDNDAFRKEVEELTGKVSKADTIAFRTKKTISERMAEDPAFYKRFSEMLDEVIRAHREKRLSDVEYLKHTEKIQTAVRDRTGDDLPPELRSYEVAKAFYGVVRDILQDKTNSADVRQIGAVAAIRIDQIISDHRIVDWTTNPDVQNKMKTEIEDFLFEFEKTLGLTISFDDIDRIMEQCIEIARVRYAA